MEKNKVLSLLGLAMKAGKVQSGEFSTEKAVKSGMAYLVMVANDASDNTKKKFQNMCLYYKVPICCYATKEELGRAIGKEYRAMVGIVDANLAKAVKKQLGNLMEIEQ